MKKILLIRLSSIGDIVLTSLTIRCLKNVYPDLQIDFLTKPQFRPVVENHLRVSNVLELNKNLLITAKEIVSGEYDCVVDLHANLRTGILKQLLPESIKVLQYNKQSLRRTLSVWLKKDLYRGEHVAEQYLDTLKELDVRNDDKGLEFFIPEKDWIYRGDVPLTHRSGYAVISLGATHLTKKLPLEKWDEICQRLNLPIVLIGGKEEIEMGAMLTETDDLKFLNKCGLYTLGQSASVVAQAKFVITQDTGMMHIAAALKKKTISIWGGTVPYLGFEPYGLGDSLSQVIEVKDLSCRPCSKYGRSSCTKEHFKCMKNISADEVVNATGIM